MEKQYVAPELKLAGDADEIVLGSTGSGIDFTGEQASIEMEFETDDEVKTES